MEMIRDADSGRRPADVPEVKTVQGPPFLFTLYFLQSRRYTATEYRGILS